jgi:membrane protease YdiL (CAAX protease family)
VQLEAPRLDELVEGGLFGVGLAVGWVYEWRNNLLAPVLMHSFSDSLGLLFLARAMAAQRTVPTTSSPSA